MEWGGTKPFLILFHEKNKKKKKKKKKKKPRPGQVQFVFAREGGVRGLPQGQKGWLFFVSGRNLLSGVKSIFSGVFARTFHTGRPGS